MTRSTPALLAAGFLALFTFNALLSAWKAAPTSDEPVHLAAGYTYLATGDFRLNPEHPPLLKLAAALPLLIDRPWPETMDEPGRARRAFVPLREAWNAAAGAAEAEWPFARVFFYALTDEAVALHGADNRPVPTTTRFARHDFVNPADRLVRSGRAVMILFGLGLGVTIFFWAREVWGRTGAAVAAGLYSADPSFIAHSAQVTTDVGAALFMTLSAYTLWRVLRAPGPGRLTLFAVCTALAALSKYSVVVLPLMLLAVLLIETAVSGKRRSVLTAGAAAALAAALFSFFAVWASYGFRQTPSPIIAVSAAETREQMETWRARNLIGGTLPGVAGEWLQGVMVSASERGVLPRPYLFGVATMLAGSERQAFVNGVFYEGGAPAYFLWTSLYKLPVPSIVLLVCGLVLALARRPAVAAAVVAPGLIYFLIAANGTINIGHRHVLPAFGFFYVAAGALGVWLDARGHGKGLLLGGAAVVLLASNIVFVPRPTLMPGSHLSYMNELAGGPARGYERLLDSNFDWGQDLLRLGEWYERSGYSGPIDLVYFGTADPRYYGIAFERRSAVTPPRGEILAISANHYMGYFVPGDRKFWRRWLGRCADPIGTAGHSILLFDVRRCR